MVLGPTCFDINGMWALKPYYFPGADARQCLSEPYTPSLQQLREDECRMFQEIQAEIAQESAAARAQMEEDQVMAQAMASSTSKPPGSRPSSTGSASEGPGSVSNRGLESASVQQVTHEGNGDVVITVRVVAKRRRTVGVQTED